MWLADIKYDWQGQTLILPIPLKAGTRYAIWHCCCDYPTTTKAENKALRGQWDAKRDSFRRQWGELFGSWPSENGKHWPGHHIRDLGHGGHPTDMGNVLPVPSIIHGVLNEQYPLCYAGNGPWNTIGPDLPYLDR